MWAPEQGPEITAAVLAQLQDGLANGATLLSSQYGFTDASIAQVMAEIGQKMPGSRFLFDRSEYLGRYEKPVVDQLIAQLQPDQWAIGTAPDGSDILLSSGAAPSAIRSRKPSPNRCSNRANLSPILVSVPKTPNRPMLWGPYFRCLSTITS